MISFAGRRWFYCAAPSVFLSGVECYHSGGVIGVCVAWYHLAR